MKKTLVAFGAIVLFIIVLMIGLNFDKPSKEEQAFIENGEKLYNQLCLACHGENGKGEGELPGTALNNQHFLNTYADGDLYNQIKDGRFEARMPEYGSILSETEINQLVSFIRSWQTETLKLEAPTAFDGDPLNGGKLYDLYCANCHGITGSGLNGTAIALGNPDFQRHTTDEQIWISAANGREETRMGPSLKGLSGVRQLSEQQITDIVSYIRKELGFKYNPNEDKHQHPVQGEENSRNEEEQSS
ncbi:c-type cytochrome [Mesobacillus maritimus]|uniref:c-type cytochrome n=1 Tax=Mesobacillus maritimus TaxID=1643336 RepID=UPI00384EC10B